VKVACRVKSKWDRIKPVLQYLLERDDPNFMLNKVIEIEATNRFSLREIPPSLGAEP
jgi:hypothetical protein